MSDSSSIDDANLPRLLIEEPPRASSSRALSRGSITTTNSRDKRGSQGGDSSRYDIREISSGRNTQRESRYGSVIAKSGTNNVIRTKYATERVNNRRGSTSKSSSISNIPQKRPRASAPVSMSDDNSDDNSDDCDYSGDIINKKRSSSPTKRTTLFSDDEDEQTTDANNKDKERESAFNEGNIERIKNLENMEMIKGLQSSLNESQIDAQYYQKLYAQKVDILNEKDEIIKNLQDFKNNFELFQSQSKDQIEKYENELKKKNKMICDKDEELKVIADLNKSDDDFNNINNTLSKKSNENNKIIKDLNDNIKSLIEENRKLTEKYHRLNENNKTLNENITDLNKDLIKRDEEFSSKNKEIANMSYDYKQLNRAALRKEDEFERLRRDYEEMVEEIKDLTFKLTQTEQNLDISERRLIFMESHDEEQYAKLNEMEEYIKICESANGDEGMKTEIENLKEVIKTYDNQSINSQQSENDIKEKVKEIENLKEIFKMRDSQSKEHTRQLNEEIEKKNGEINNLRDAIKCKDNQGNINIDKTNVDRIIEDLKKKLKDKEHDKEELRKARLQQHENDKTIYELNKNLNISNERMKLLTKTVEQNQNYIETLKLTLKDINEKGNQSVNVKDAKVNHNERFKDKKSTQNIEQGADQNLQNEIDQLNSKLTEKRKIIKQYEDKKRSNHYFKQYQYYKNKAERKERLLNDVKAEKNEEIRKLEKELGYNDVEDFSE